MYRFIAVMALAVLSAGSQVHAAPGAGERFKKYADKYPSDLFEGEPDVTRRLQNLLAAHYIILTERLQTQSPFDIVGGILVAKSCKAHECGSEDAILLIDLSNGEIHCLIHSAIYPNKVKIFTENVARFPEEAMLYAIRK